MDFTGYLPAASPAPLLPCSTVLLAVLSCRRSFQYVGAFAAVEARIGGSQSFFGGHEQLTERGKCLASGLASYQRA